ncbi:hypothetical protein TWF696_000123 [Orbilia brochopaga]|uniref:Uncharacterized protein n=1 Tax=Orbilia brochopaga TaxID=3140254 RepID=A0AAV9VAC7_9PEZI
MPHAVTTVLAEWKVVKIFCSGAGILIAGKTLFDFSIQTRIAVVEANIQHIQQDVATIRADVASVKADINYLTRHLIASTQMDVRKALTRRMSSTETQLLAYVSVLKTLLL